VAGSTYTGGHVSHTGNLFLPEETSVAMVSGVDPSATPTAIGIAGEVK
jgi:hypothetical protein